MGVMVFEKRNCRWKNMRLWLRQEEPWQDAAAQRERERGGGGKRVNAYAIVTRGDLFKFDWLNSDFRDSARDRLLFLVWMREK